MASLVELKPTAENSKFSQDIQTEKKLRKVPTLCSTRYGIAFIIHFCNFTLKAQSVILNITMVTMVNSNRSQMNGSAKRLPVDLLDGLNDTVKSFPMRGSAFGGQFALWEKWGPPCERSRLCTIALSGMPLGISIAILLGGVISQALGWPFAFYIFGSLGCVCCILWFVLVYDDPASHPWISVTEKEYIRSSMTQQVSFSKPCLPVKAILRSLPFWSMCLCGFSHQWFVNTLVAYTPTYISSVFNVNIRENGFLSALPFLAAWVVGVLGGQLTDFLLTKNFRLVTVRKLATVLGTFPPSAFLVGLPYLTSSYITSIALLTIACGLCPFCQSGIYINALDIAPRHASFLMGASRGFAQAAAILSPTVCGFILTQDLEYGWKNVFLLAFAINLAGLIFYLIFGKADVQDWAKERKLTRL
ncbi:PREDICTED: sodium-dependent phosphate transport protein 4 isoform X2 [Condylura cristata]|uniref:sodium-dependent phosphate transport protein 4 isoform X2 n=1 Tax=Condylura cristata TaxID=143302 RepID=UPI0003346884|nr:PREDICTED: sodium-dependent phosphate transport protein 4 isoform X2 [Condylura cristata]